MLPDFRALLVDKIQDQVSVGIKQVSSADLPEGDTVIRTAFSSVNFKDGLATTANGKIVRSWPFIPGIDLAGIVVSSTSPRFKQGDRVLATGFELGVSHFGGFSEYARVPSDWLIPVPEQMSLRDSMVLGTAGLTAMLSIHRMEENGLSPEKGPVLVTGASGGVGSLAVWLLSKCGYQTAAVTGKASAHDYLRMLGAGAVLPREAVSPAEVKPLGKEQWAGAVDPVGGKTLAYVLSSVQYGGTVASSGLTGGWQVPTTVYPFILRGVSLLGIDSAYCPMSVRTLLWKRMADLLRDDPVFPRIGTEITLDQLPSTLSAILKGELTGRTVVRLSDEESGI